MAETSHPGEGGGALRALRFGFLLMGAGAALAVPFVPLRSAAPVLALGAGLLLLRPGAHEELRIMLLAYAWFWGIGCVFAAD